MSQRITEEDFIPVYVDVHKDDADPYAWPKLVRWALEAPFLYKSCLVSASILERQLTPDSDWEYIVGMSVAVSDKPDDLPENEEDDEDKGIISLPSEWSFEDAIDAIYAKVDEVYERSLNRG